ncbi:hypothetical protein Tco_0107310, partial [Tanacetum coccineum]
EDEHEFLAEEQPLPPIVSLTAESPGYVVESDPEEYEDYETEDGPVDYPMDRGEDGDDDDSDSFGDDDGDSSGDDADDEDEDEEDKDKEDEEEEEHPAPSDSVVVVPTVKPVSLSEGTKHVIPLPSIDISTTGARITVWLQASISLPPEAEVERLLAMTTPSASPPISLSPPSAGERLARPLLMQLLPHYHHLHYHHLLSERLILSTPGSRYEIGESSTARPTRARGVDYEFVSTVDAKARRQGISKVGYGIRDSWVEPAEAVPEITPMTVGEVNTRVTELAEL